MVSYNDAKLITNELLSDLANIIDRIDKNEIKSEKQIVDEFRRF